MLSIGLIGGGGAKYYEADGYYAKDDPEHKAASAWHGKGAKAQGLHGLVEAKDLDRVLAGFLPDGKQLGRLDSQGNVNHRTGQDLTFSAPKSVSLLALLGEDKRLLKAHDAAVKATLDYIEAKILETRLQIKGEMTHQGDQKMVAATFRHDTSRNLDPQLHTHALVANMVQGKDDKWRTVDFRSLFQNKMFLGTLYRCELAERIQELGYKLEKTHSDGRFEVKGIERSVIEAFSTRRADILKSLEAQGMKKALASDKARAALFTRAEKKEPERTELTAMWKQRTQEIGFEPQEIVQQAINKEEKREREIAALEDSQSAESFTHRHDPAQKAVEYAIQHLSERNSVFKNSDVLLHALARNPGSVKVMDIQQAITAHLKEKTLFTASAVGKDMLTTRQALAWEAESIALMKKERAQRIASPRIVDRGLANGRLTRGQKEAAKLILTTKDRIVGIQGYAGVGKTTMLKRTRELSEKQGYQLMGLAPSTSAAQTLYKESGITSETLQRFLAQYDGVAHGRLSAQGRRELRAEFKKTILIVDESSLVATRPLRDLLVIAREINLPKLVLVGDKKQLGAIEAGKPFEQLQQAGMKTAIMDEIMRQRDPILREAVEASVATDKRNIQRAFDKLGDNIIETGRHYLAQAVVGQFLAEKNKGSVGLIAPSHALRKEINALLRNTLVFEGKITGPEMKSEQWISRGMTEAEKRHFKNYNPGDTVIFNKAYKTLGIEKAQAWQVTQRQDTSVRLERDGRAITWQPNRIAGGRKGAIEVYRSENICLRAGDWIRFTRNDESLGLANGSTGFIERVTGNSLRLNLDDGRSLEIDKATPALRHIDHAWASTAHAFQGRTVDRMIGVLESEHPHLTTQRNFYVQISRARDKAILFTDEATKLKHHLERTTGDRIAALEGVGKTLINSAEKSATPTDRFMEGNLQTRPRLSSSRSSIPTPKQTEMDFGRDLER